MNSGDPIPYSGPHITMTSPFREVLIQDEVDGEVYKLVVRDGKIELLATSRQGIRQQTIEKVIE